MHDLVGLRRNQLWIVRLNGDQNRQVRAGIRGLELRQAEGVRLVELDEAAEAGGRGLGEAVRVLADDVMALLQSQDPLGLDTEWLDPEVLAVGEQRLPDMQRMAGRHVQLVGELTGEADSPDDAVRNASDGAAAYVEVRECLGVEADALNEPQQ